MMTLFELLYLLPKTKIVKIGTAAGEGWDYIYYNDIDVLTAKLPNEYFDRKVIETFHSCCDHDMLGIIVEGEPYRDDDYGFWTFEEFKEAFKLEG